MVNPETVDELKTLVASKLDVTEFLDVLGWTLEDLVDVLENSIFEDSFEELARACG